MSQAPTNISTYFYDASCIAISFTDPSSAYFNSSQTYYYLASAVDLSGNKTTYATGTKSPIYIQGLSAGYTYTCSLYMIQTASSDSISFTTLSYPTISDISLSDVSFNFINLKWTGTDLSYVKVSRRVGTILPYTDICGSDYVSPYLDTDISGNTTYYYYVTPYMTKYGSTAQGSTSSVVSRTTPVAYPMDVSATFYDMSAIRLTFSTPKNSYTTIAPSYTAKAVYGGNIITASGTSPILIQNLSSDTTYACYILTYLDGSLGSTSNAISVKTNEYVIGPLRAIYLYKSDGTTLNTFLKFTKPNNTGGYNQKFSSSMVVTSNSYNYTFINGTYNISTNTNTYYGTSSTQMDFSRIGSGQTTTEGWTSTNYTNPGVYTGTTTTTSSGTLYSGDWVQYVLPYKIYLSGHSFLPRSGYTGSLPSTYVIAGSNDGSTWTNIYTATSQGNYVSTLVSYSYTMSSVAYNYIRLIIQACGTAQGCQIQQWNITGYTSGKTVSYTAPTDYVFYYYVNSTTVPTKDQTNTYTVSGVTVTSAYPEGSRTYNISNSQVTISSFTFGSTYSICFWIYENGLGGSFLMTDSGNSNNGPIIWNDGGTNMSFSATYNSNGKYSIANYIAYYTVWGHWCFTYNGSTGKFYKNGYLQTSGTMGYGSSGSKNWVFNSSVSSYLNHIMIYNRELSASEVFSIYMSQF